MGIKEYLERRKRELLERYIRTGIVKSEDVIRAFLKVPREEFVLPNYKMYAYDDTPLPTVKGQTISAPHMALILLEALDLKPGMKVLEVGTGTGYQAALMAEIVGEKGLVVTIERIKELAEIARKNLERLGYKNVIVVWGDGLKGYPKYAPYDRILLATAVEEIPKELREQLKVGGKLVAPVIERGLRGQSLMVFEKTPEGIRKKKLMDVIFVVAKEGVEE